MKYRPFGNTGRQVSALGIGTMRLPVVDELAHINEPLAIQVIRHLIDGGVNYLDTAWDYHEGNAELVVGKALKDGYRQKVRLVTKLPIWLVRSAQDFDKFLNAQLEKLAVDHVDLYLLHAINRPMWYKVYSLGVLEWLEKAQGDGRIGLTGFSFHDEYSLFQEVVDAWDKWSMCQIQYNYLDQDSQAGTRGLRYAAEKGLAVSIMEPLRGGGLANPPKSIRQLFDTAAVPRTPAEWALQWLWNKPEVSVVLSGMNTMEQVDENLASASRSGVGSLSPAEVDILEQVAKEFPRPPISCTRCHYCMPCPNHVNIPVNLDLYNRAIMNEQVAIGKLEYQQIPSAQRASECVHCQSCEVVCPQKIAISDWMEEIDRILG